MQTDQEPWPPGKLLSRLALVCVAYYAGARLGLALSFKPDYIAPLWPPNAVLLTALLLVPARHWWALALAVVPAELAADLPAGIPWLSALAFVAADCVEALVAALALRLVLRKPLQFDTLRHTATFILCAVLLAPFAAAFPGAATALIGQTGTNYWLAWRTWFMGDALTHLTLTAFLVAWLKCGWPRGVKNWRRVLEGGALAVLLAAVGLAVFGRSVDSPATLLPLVYVPLPLLLWSAVRFGYRGMFTASLFIVFVTIWHASTGQGPFAMESPARNVLNLQVFLMLGLTPLMLLASISVERRTVIRELNHYQSRLEDLVDERTRELQQAQQQLIVSERLAALGQFSGSVAHEIRNPLSAIVAAVSLMGNRLPDADPKIQSYMEKIIRNSQRITDIIDSILRLTLEDRAVHKPLDIMRLLRDTAAARITGDALDVFWDAPDSPIWILGDSGQLSIALGNVIRNALQAMPRGGRLGLQVHTDNGRVVLQISDSGPGIRKEHLEKVFEPLYTTKTYGMGFGLAIVRMIAERHHGEVQVDSQQDLGTTVTLRLPLMEPGAPAGNTPAENPR